MVDIDAAGAAGTRSRLTLRQLLTLGTIGMAAGGAIAAIVVALADGGSPDRIDQAKALVSERFPNAAFSSVEACPAPDGRIALVTGYLLARLPDGSSTGSKRFKVGFADDGPAQVQYAPDTDDWFALYDQGAAAGAGPASCHDRALFATTELLDERIAAARAELEAMRGDVDARMGPP